MTDEERIEQIRRALASSNPKTENPSWYHTHNDCLFLLGQLDELKKAQPKKYIIRNTFGNAIGTAEAV